MNGRILKIKTGYNPNSSSIGVDLVAFLTAGAAATLLFNTLATVISAAKVSKHGRLNGQEGQPASGLGEEQA